MPDCMAESDNGILLIANGMQRMLRWDGLSKQAEPAGVSPPATAPVLAGQGQGPIRGTYSAYCRFVDKDGLFSNLSPVSAEVTLSSFSGDVLAVTVWDFQAIDALARRGGSGQELAGLTALIGTPVQVTTKTSHGLITGTRVTLAGVGGSTEINGTFLIIQEGATTFRLQGITAASAYTGGGTYAAGVQSIAYSSVPLPAETRVRRRQLLRNTDGQTATYYVDVDTDDLSSTSGFSSTLDDDTLSAGTAVPLLDTDLSPLANRFTVPPDHKSVLAAHLGRMFAAVDVVYSEGCVVITNGSATVTGVGTEWTAELAGRFLYVVGVGRSYQIASVSAAAQTLTLAETFAGTTNPYARYAIRPAPAEAKLVYYTEAGLPEAWPATNALSVPSDGDEITGLVVSNSFLYILERRHVYRFTFQADPGIDGYVWPNVVGRGCLNNRTWAEVNGTLYFLDEQGVFQFDGGADIKPVSQPIQDIFRGGGEASHTINWSAGAFFHCVHFPPQETVRWFVALSGDYLPRHALAYNYRLQRWWIEEFNAPVGASCVAQVDQRPAVLLGMGGRRVVKYWEGGLDGPRGDAGTVRGTVTSATLTTLVDSAAAFPPAGVVGCPVAIVDGKGKGQVRYVSAVSGTTLSLVTPWLDVPDATSTYQLGAVEWRMKTGFYRFIPDETQNPRRIEVIFQPVSNPCSMDIKAFRDLEEDPVVWQTRYSSVAANGVRSARGDPNLVIDLTKPVGYAMKRFSAHKELLVDATRFWALQLSGFSNDEKVIIADLRLEGAAQREGG